MRPRLPVAVAVLLGLVAACDSGDRSEDPGPRPEPVVVYASQEDESVLPDWFAGFTDETGIPVTVRYGDSANNTASVINDEGSPPADLLLTRTVADIWRAADRGALRPIDGNSLELVPAALRDPDGFWAALDFRLAVIVHAPGASPVRRYADLALAEFRGQVCLTSSQLSVNRSTVAMLIDELGTRPAELIVRGWIQNLALPPLDDEGDLIAAVKAGTCVYGIASALSASAVDFTVPEQAYFDVAAVGIARHARYAESAQMLLQWMLQDKALQRPENGSTRNVGIAGWRDEEATRLAERAAYR